MSTIFGSDAASSAETGESRAVAATQAIAKIICRFITILSLGEAGRLLLSQRLNRCQRHLEHFGLLFFLREGDEQMAVLLNRVRILKRRRLGERDHELRHLRER